MGSGERNMKAVVQRVTKATVTVDGRQSGRIGQGLLVLLGVGHKDTEKEAAYLVQKIIHLRIFEDDNSKMNLSLQQIGGDLLVVSQFTLLGDCRKGRRPSFVNAAEPSRALKLYNVFIRQARSFGIRTETGEFGAMMDVELTNSGPVTLIIDSNPSKPSDSISL